MTPDSPATGPGNEALAEVIDRQYDLATGGGEWPQYKPAALDLARVILASDWLAAHTAAAVSEARDAAVGEVVERVEAMLQPPGTVPVGFGDNMPWHQAYQKGRHDLRDEIRAALQPDHADEDSERAKFASECCQDCGMHPGIGCQWWCKNNKPDHADAGDEAPAPQDEPAEGEAYRPCAGCDAVGESCRAVGCPAIPHPTEQAPSTRPDGEASDG